MDLSFESNFEPWADEKSFWTGTEKFDDAFAEPKVVEVATPVPEPFDVVFPEPEQVNALRSKPMATVQFVVSVRLEARPWAQ